MNEYFKNKKKILGLDLGVSSIGWALFACDENEKPECIIDLGSYIFTQIETGKDGKLLNQTRREKRCSRRMRRRKVYRLKELRKLFIKYNYINNEEDFFDICSKYNEFPLIYKVKGLKEKLCKEELMVSLYHYMKFKGFESSRKKEESNIADTKLLGKINETKSNLNGNSISSFLLKNYYQNGRFHNSDKEYLLAVDRDTYKTEIECLLNKQIGFGVCSEQFKEEFLDLYKKRRNFFEGPDGRIGKSKYGIDREKESSLIDRMRGTCELDPCHKEKRACKDSFTAQSFILISKLLNLSFILNGNIVLDSAMFKLKDKSTYKYELTSLQIRKLYNKYIFKDIKYKELLRELNIIDYFNNNEISIPEIIATKNDYKKAKEKNVTLNTILLDKIFFKKSIFLYKTNLILNLKEENYEIYDEISECFFLYKDDEILKNKLYDSFNKKYNTLKLDYKKIQQLINECDNPTATINISLKYAKIVNAELLNGKNYHLIKQELLMKDRRYEPNNGIYGFPKDMNEILKETNLYIKNPRVKYVLGKLFKLMNAIIDEYGQINRVNIEFLRELKKDFNERNKIYIEQRDNFEKNLNLKLEMKKKYPNIFSNLNRIRKDDLIKYKLFLEQDRKCLYSGNCLREDLLFSNNYCQIDHIIPYSRSFDDSYNNKVLVLTEENQNKKNNTPFEYMCNNKIKWNNFKSLVSTNYNMSKAKRENLLKQHYEQEIDFDSAAISDSSYIAKLGKFIINFYLFNNYNDSKIHVFAPYGIMTDKLKGIWDLKGRTHSYLSNKKMDYKIKKDYFIKKCDYNEYLKIKYKDGNNKNGNGSFKNASIIIENFPYYTKYSTSNIEYQAEIKSINLNFAENDKEKYYKYKEFIDILNGDSFDSNSIFNELGNLTFTEAISKIENIKIINNYQKAFLVEIISKIYSFAQEKELDKDRSNHLHHALDACVIACTNQSIINKISNSYKYKEIKQEQFNIPLPYQDFKNEVLLRVYEKNNKDKNTLINELKKLENYKIINEQFINHIQILIPARSPDKFRIKAISGETIYGSKIINNEERIIQKIKVEDIKEKDLEKIYDKNGGNKEVYNILREWFKTGKKNSPMFIKNTKEGTKQVPIKSVKVIGNCCENYVKLGKKRYADVDTFLGSVIYKNKDHNDKFMYIRYISSFDLCNNNYDYKIKLFYKSKFYKLVSLNELNRNYDKLIVINRYSLIELIKNDSESILAYAGGGTNGSIEYYSLLGDNFDFGENQNKDGRYRPAISTFSNIKLRNISILGKIS